MTSYCFSVDDKVVHQLCYQHCPSAPNTRIMTLAVEEEYPPHQNFHPTLPPLSTLHSKIKSVPSQPWTVGRK
eukprot:5110453-Pyramimonas_sp.AAC.1